MHDTFGGCVVRGQDMNHAVFTMTRCMTRQIGKRVALDRTRRPIEDVSPKHVYRGATHDTFCEGFVNPYLGQGGASVCRETVDTSHSHLDACAQYQCAGDRKPLP